MKKKSKFMDAVKNASKKDKGKKGGSFKDAAKFAKGGC